MFDEIAGRFGRLDIFIQNASNGYLGPLEYATPEHWEKSYRTNVVSLHQGALRAADLMREGGQIAALTTPAAQRCTPLFGLQGSVKAAIESLVRYLAVELAPRGIRVNSFAPGAIYGEGVDADPPGCELDSEVAHQGLDGGFDRALQAEQRRTTLGRGRGQGGDLASLPHEVGRTQGALVQGDHVRAVALLPMLGGGVLQRTQVPVGRVLDKDVQPSEPSRDLVEHGVEVARVRHRAPEVHSFVSVLAQLGRRRLAAVP